MSKEAISDQRSAVSPAPKPLLTGRALSTLTPAELIELITLAKADIALDENDGEYNEAGDEGRSMHPQFKFIHYPYGQHGSEQEPDEEEIVCWGWSGGMTDCGEEYDTYPWTINVGTISGPMGDWWAELPIVRWFLEHGWDWAEPLKAYVPPEDDSP